MIAFPHIDPVIFSLGPLQIRWYGLMYVLGFFASFVLVRHQIRKFKIERMEEYFENLNLVLMLSLVLGGRLGYVLFYNPAYYFSHPLEVLATWQGGMSFHGGLLGLLIGGAIYCLKHNLSILRTADLYVAAGPIGLGLGRLGNFINAELYGRVSDVPWAMVFPGGGPLARHPSQLYEFLLEGVLLFTILWNLKNIQHRRGWPTGSILAAFLICYGIFRIFVELFREPDVQIGFLWNFLTMGQLLSCLMVVAGFFVIFLSRLLSQTQK